MEGNGPDHRTSSQGCETGAARLRLPATGNRTRVGVVIPAHNAAEFIVETLDSIRMQTHRELEIVVVDDGSKDDTAALVRGVGDPRIQVIRQDNHGVASARNCGVASLRTDFVAFCDQDDVWHPAKIARQLQAMSATGFLLSCTGYRFWFPVGGRYEPGVNLLADDPSLALRDDLSGWVYHEMLLESQVLTSSVLVHRSLLDATGSWDESLEYAEDWDYWLRASRLTEFAFLSAPLVAYRQRPGQGSRLARQRNWSTLVVDRAIERWGVAGPDGRVPDARRFRRRRAVAWRDFGSSNIEAGDVRLGRAALVKAIRLDPWHLGQWKLLARSIVRRQPGAPSR